MLTGLEMPQLGLAWPQERNIFTLGSFTTLATPFAIGQPQFDQPEPAQLIQQQTPAPRPSDLERLIGVVFQLAKVLAEGYVKFVLLPKQKAEVCTELKEAVRKNRAGDVVWLLLATYGLNKMSGN